MSPNQLDVVSIGEAQLRLEAAAGVSLVEADRMRTYVAGTEGNVLTLLCRLGASAGLVTSLPDMPFGHRVAREYRESGLDLGSVVWRTDGRLGLYFVERGTAPVPSRVFYDRAESCFARMSRAEVDWGYVGSARLIHLTGLTAALGENAYEIVTNAVDVARENHRLLSVDVNYRSLLWAPDVARERLEPLLNAADVLFCSRRDAATVFALTGDARDVAARLADRFGPRFVLVSDGPRPVEVFADGARLSATPPPTTVVDRVGAGDALLGGFLHGVLNDDIELGLTLGVTAAALALTRHGDLLHTSLPELRSLSDVIATGDDIVR